MKNLKKILACFLILCLTVSASGCKRIESFFGKSDAPPVKSDFPVYIGNERFDKAPSSIVSLSPAVTEILCDIGLKDKIIGATDYCEIDGVELIGSSANPDIEKILNLKPELLITLSNLSAMDLLTLENSGIHVYKLNSPKNYIGLCELYIELSLIMYGANNSANISNNALKDLDEAMTKADDKNFDIKFAYIITSGFFVAGSDTLASEILSVFGENVAKDSENFEMTPSEVAKKTPNVIFISDDIDEDSLPSALRKLNAIFIRIDNSYFESPTNKIADLINQICEELEKNIT